jgi:4-hydroxy-3-methylbut-2-en-1-yl diphosphate reductase
VEIYLAHTQGFCAGVSRAIEIVKSVLAKYGAPLYVRHHIVHNTAVIADFEKQGVVFVDYLSEVPIDERIIFSAHGVSSAVYQKAEARNLKQIDATCPLVMKVHKEAQRLSENNIQTILIGHKGHQEVIGTSGYIRPDLLFLLENKKAIHDLKIDTTKPVGYLTQTTLSISEADVMIRELKKRFPNIISPAKEDICFATQNRQDAVIELTKFCDLIIVCGSPTSSNSNRLKETAQKHNVQSYIIDTADEMKLEWLENKQKIGISSGASVPASIVTDLINRMCLAYPDATIHRKESTEKGIVFDMPVI